MDKAEITHDDVVSLRANFVANGPFTIAEFKRLAELAGPHFRLIGDTLSRVVTRFSKEEFAELKTKEAERFFVGISSQFMYEISTGLRPDTPDHHLSLLLDDLPRYVEALDWNSVAGIIDWTKVDDEAKLALMMAARDARHRARKQELRLSIDKSRAKLRQRERALEDYLSRKTAARVVDWHQTSAFLTRPHESL